MTAVCIFAFLSSLEAFPRASVTPEVERLASVAKGADDHFSRLLSKHSVSAAAVVVVDRTGPILTRVYGPIDAERTLWRAASVSKALTAIAVMKLVEEDKLDLDSDVNRYLKSFQVPNTYPQPITIRQLLEHRSGLDDRFIGDGFVRGEQPAMRALMKRFLPARVYPPDEVTFYSNYGYGLVGAVIEDVTGERFENYMAVNVLRPLGMSSSTFQQPLTPESVSAMVRGKWSYQHAAPAGGLTTTAGDMSRFLLATLQQDGAVISKTSFQTMTSTSRAAPPARSGGLERPAAPPSGNFGLLQGLGYWIGRGRNHRLVGSSGDYGTFHNVMIALPDEGIGFVFLVSGKGPSGFWNFFRAFLSAQFGDAPPAQLPPQTESLRLKNGDRKRLARLAGLYRTVRYPHHELAKTYIAFNLTRVTIEDDGALRFRGARWIEKEPLQFEREDGSERVSFREDKAGRIRFLGDSEERIAWYESGYANVAFYFLFILFFGIACWRAKGLLRLPSAAAWLHSVGWLGLVAMAGPSNLITGLPLALQAILWIGTALPLFLLWNVQLAWRSRSLLGYTSTLALALYVLFIRYWNLYA